MPASSIQALRRGLAFYLLLLAAGPWAVSVYTPVRTEVLFPEHRSWQTGQQGWHPGLMTGFTLLDDVTVLGLAERSPSISTLAPWWLALWHCRG